MPERILHYVSPGARLTACGLRFDPRDRIHLGLVSDEIDEVTCPRCRKARGRDEEGAPYA